jgi:hypothetical protein
VSVLLRRTEPAGGEGGGGDAALAAEAQALTDELLRGG